VSNVRRVNFALTLQGDGRAGPGRENIVWDGSHRAITAPRDYGQARVWVL